MMLGRGRSEPRSYEEKCNGEDDREGRRKGVSEVGGRPAGAASGAPTKRNATARTMASGGIEEGIYGASAAAVCLFVFVCTLTSSSV
jgi:hypothetical protein